jgi:hypothetical protein
MLSQPEGPEAAGTSVLYGVEDVQATHARIAADGVKFEEQPHVIAQVEEKTFISPSAPTPRATLWA